ncbi:MAG TPA: 50S ribosomal protein L13 [Candidatus Omnitrophota bacterium]|nr:50S ribosomal protein L13 [Candidatus Omnitrophota bacterium]
MKTHIAKQNQIEKKWFLIDAKGKILGRLAVKIAGILTGKGKTNYTPYVEMGDYVIVINVKEIRVTGKKAKEKTYDHYTGYPGGRDEYVFEDLMAKKPEEVLFRAVKGMLPKNRMADRMLRHLKIYAGSEYQESAQKPVVVS